MLVNLILCLTYSLLWQPSSSLHISKGLSAKQYESDSTKYENHFGNINAFRSSSLNVTRRADDNDEKGREIVEITSADPTTDSTLIVPNYPIDCINERECDLMTSVSAVETTPLPTFKPYSQEELNLYLKNYVNNNGKLPEEAVINGDQPSNKLANLYMDEPVNVIEGTAKDEGKSQQTSKSWQLMQAQTHKHPYDDHTGWVSLEPVPWSASQVQKWEPNNKPQHLPHWAEPNDQHHQSTWNKPTRWQDRPWNKKPTYEYKPSPRPPSPSHWNDYSTSSHWSSGNPDIITDSGPSHFPPSEPTKPPSWYERPQTGYNNDQEQHYQQHHHHPSTHPSEGDGRWVLLSSTKGYSVPHRSRDHQRSLFINTKTPPEQGTPSLKSHRSVRLTVLPPLNGTTKTTTSHGGLLEVEKTMQTVDEAQREHAAKMMRLESLNQENQAKAHQPDSAKRSSATIRIYPVKASDLQTKSKAMLAAVGAGMIPATMAMLVPMVLGRKRRNAPEYNHQIYYYHDPTKFAVSE